MSPPSALHRPSDELRMHASSPSPFIEARSLLDLSSEENFFAAPPPPPPYKLPPKLHIKTGSDPVPLPVGPTLQPALSRRLSTAGSLSLPAIDELEPLLFESPGPILQQPLSAKQTADMLCNVARFQPGGALTPGSLGKSPLGCGQPLPCQRASCGPSSLDVPPLPALPPIAIRVGEKKKAPPAGQQEQQQQQQFPPPPLVIATPSPGLKIRTPRRHFGTGVGAS